jgi:hypothetical protein
VPKIAVAEHCFGCIRGQVNVCTDDSKFGVIIATMSYLRATVCFHENVIGNGF